MAQEVNIELVRGSTKLVTFTITAGGSAVDFTSHAVVATGRRDYRDTDTEFTHTFSNGANGSVFASGVLGFLLTAAETSALADSLVYDIQGTDTGGTITTYVRGKITVLPNVT